MSDRIHIARVVSNEACAEDTMRLVIEAPVLASSIRAGQFMNLEVPGDASHILRIPLSFSKADPEQGTIELLYAVVGEGTRRLAAMTAGGRLSLLGPLGNGWIKPEKEGRCLLVAGGIGLPPIEACARMLDEAGLAFDAVVAVRDAAHLVDEAVREIETLPGCGKIVVTSDDGSVGLKGFATDGMKSLLESGEYAQVFSCGPTPMLRAVSVLCLEGELACQVSLEALMGCGFGACSCCNVELVGGGYALCCSDGPVFDAKEVVL